MIHRSLPQRASWQTEDPWFKVQVPLADRFDGEHLDQLRKEGQING